MNLITINNENIIGYNTYEFLEFYKNEIGYSINNEEEGILFLYYKFFPNQILEFLPNSKNIIVCLKEIIDNLYRLSIHKLKKVNSICFFYPFTFYSKFDYDFDILKFLKREIEAKFNKEVFFVLNNHMRDDDYKHFSVYRYDMFSLAREIKKIKINEKKEKKFISINLKIRQHRDDLENFIDSNNLYEQFYFSYTQKNKTLWHIEDYGEFGKKFLNNELKSGHRAFEFYLNDDLFNTKNGHFFDKSYYYIITETSCHDSLCFISEKTYKAFYHKIPFIVIGNPFTLKNLREEGFKTFNKWIDESYDEETNYEKRKNKIFNEILRLNSIDNHDKTIDEMQQILEHNYEHFLDIKNIKKDFLNLFPKKYE